MRRLQMMAALAGALLAGCKNDASTEPAPPPAVVTKLGCQDPNGQLVNCALTLDQNAGFSIELRSSSCKATDDELSLTLPVSESLTLDACHEPLPRHWDFAGPYPRNTEVSFQVKSQKYDRAPSLQVTGDYPEWTVTFEDGYDLDYDDLIFVVRALPPG